MSEKEYMALRNALASTQMEGYEITKQTEQDCVRLLEGENGKEGIITFVS